MNLNEMAKAIHENAVAHGWWETPRPDYEILALIHSEWSEALEEYRAGRDWLWYGEGGKPEGIGVEIADGIIRLLDWCAEKCENLDGNIRTKEHMMRIAEEMIESAVISERVHDVPFIIWYLHEVTMVAWKKLDAGYIIGLAAYFCKENGYDLEELIRIKHEYNKTRPYRHGGKKC